MQVHVGHAVGNGSGLLGGELLFALDGLGIEVAGEGNHADIADFC